MVDIVPSILFRAYNSESQGMNSSSAFAAGKHVKKHEKAEFISQQDEHQLLMDAAKHFEPHNIEPTPFISLSPSLIWVLREGNAFEFMYAR